MADPSSEPFPTFRYHPDPLATGAIEASDVTCPVCDQARGYAYTGIVYAEEEVVDELCPWCIADGSAAEHFDGEFTDSAGIDDGVPEDAVDEIALRTPGFEAWQQERWLGHCGDGAAFVGRAGWAELQDHPDAIDALRSDWADVPEVDADAALRALHLDGDATAYLFRCLHCGVHLAYADAS